MKNNTQIRRTELHAACFALITPPKRSVSSRDILEADVVVHASKPLRVSVAEAFRRLQHAENMLSAYPTAWHGVRAGWKGEATRARRKIEALREK